MLVYEGELACCLALEMKPLARVANLQSWINDKLIARCRLILRFLFDGETHALEQLFVLLTFLLLLLFKTDLGIAVDAKLEPRVVVLPHNQRD